MAPGGAPASWGWGLVPRAGVRAPLLSKGPAARGRTRTAPTSLQSPRVGEPLWSRAPTRTSKGLRARAAPAGPGVDLAVPSPRNTCKTTACSSPSLKPPPPPHTLRPTRIRRQVHGAHLLTNPRTVSKASVHQTQRCCPTPTPLSEVPESHSDPSSRLHLVPPALCLRGPPPCRPGGPCSPGAPLDRSGTGTPRDGACAGLAQDQRH